MTDFLSAIRQFREEADDEIVERRQRPEGRLLACEIVRANARLNGTHLELPARAYLAAVTAIHESWRHGALPWLPRGGYTDVLTRFARTGITYRGHV